ncbi:alpha/beta fold hydrolase [Microbulbifer taiwanensis]|uniref:Alpha/beta fold hydrolase n=1 Tax=Microbulbifer taiwanensis TaxID=986746 RepID=A0ABW1YRF5_9GAMM|nr:alpha/beta fold hydrolase [Microbulbifer taiwanensis]
MTQETQSIDHFISAGGGHQLMVQELVPARGTENGAAVLCLHGIFSDSRFFYNSVQQGAGRYLLDQGYRVLLGNLRGHGRSRWPNGEARCWDWSFDTYVDSDVPALIRFASEQHKGPLLMLCHSFGGYAALAALGLDPSLQAEVSGVAALASAINDYSDGGLSKRIQLPLSDLVAHIFGRMPARRLGLGPSDEPPALMRQLALWAARGSFASVDGSRNYWKLLRNVKLPVYAGIGAADRFHASPARAKKLVEHLGSKDITFETFGRAQGFGHDFSHFDIAAGKRAQSVVLPCVHAWMEKYY